MQWWIIPNKQVHKQILYKNTKGANTMTNTTSPIISQKQIDFLSWEMGAFFHFGIRTFHQGHKDWDLVPMPASNFNPTALDCDNWISTIKRAGMTYAILVCKHHDGFANWPTAYSDYSVKSSPWKDGKGDVVKEFVDACNKHDIKVGLYYSPAEFGSSSKTALEYDDYFVNQISELLGGYGKVDYLWFDGCGSEGHNYDTVRIVKAIRALQPGILIFNMWDPDTRWVGNESGVANMPNSSVVSSVDFSVQTDVKDLLENECFLPAECDCRMRLHNWFYSDDDEDTVKSVDELMGLYYYSVGRGSNFLINISPDDKGLLPQKDVTRVVEFGDEVKRRFANPIEADVTTNGNICTITFKKPQLVNHVVLMENIILNGVTDYVVRAYPYNYGEAIKVHQSNTIGHKAICQFPTIYSGKIDIVLNGETTELVSATAYYAQ